MITRLDPKWHPLFKAVVEQNKLDLATSGHGPHHWFRVIEIGLRLAEADPEIDPDVIIAFGLLHDSGRTHDHHCMMHGKVAGAYVIPALINLIPLSSEQMMLAVIACTNHTSAMPGDFPLYDNTLLACFDADRLDLWRVGILPDNKYLFTEAAKQPEIQAWANANGELWTIPSWGLELLEQVGL